MTDWSTARWLITGASSGFGRALAVEVAGRGGQVIAASRSPATPDDLARKHAGRLFPIAFDAGQGDAAEAMIADVEARHGPIDVLVNNAGYGLIGAVEEVSDAELRAIMEVNFFGSPALIRAALPSMRARGSGFIVNLSSISGVTAPPGSASYAASKFAIEGLSESLRRESRSLGIHVMIVEPGPFRTAFHHQPTRFARMRIGAYAAVEERRDTPPSDAGLTGDPERGARLIVDAMMADRPPERLVLGASAVDTIRKALQRRLEELESWADISASADFPDG